MPAASKYEEVPTPKGANGKSNDNSLPPDPRPPYFHWTDCLVGIDMFGVRPTLEVKGKRKFKSCWGAFVSFLCILLILLYIFF